MFFHFHSTPAFHRKTIVQSAVTLQILIVVVIVIDLLTTIDQTLQIIIYTLPFVFHVIFSLFVKRKESWMFGAIGCTLFSMVVAVVVLLLSI